MISRKNLFIIYLFYIAFVSLSAFLFAFLFQEKFHVMDQNFNIIIENLSFEFGGLVKNLFYTGNYFQITNDIKFYLIKLPAIPFLLLFLFKISLNYFFIVIFKNILIFTLYFFFVTYCLMILKIKFYLLL